MSEKTFHTSDTNEHEHDRNPGLICPASGMDPPRRSNVRSAVRTTIAVWECWRSTRGLSRSTSFAIPKSALKRRTNAISRSFTCINSRGTPAYSAARRCCRRCSRLDRVRDRRPTGEKDYVFQLRQPRRDLRPRCSSRDAPTLHPWARRIGRAPRPPVAWIVCLHGSQCSGRRAWSRAGRRSRAFGRTARQA